MGCIADQVPLVIYSAPKRLLVRVFPVTTDSILEVIGIYQLFTRKVLAAMIEQ